MCITLHIKGLLKHIFSLEEYHNFPLIYERSKAKERKSIFFSWRFFLIVAEVKTRRNFYAGLQCKPSCYRLMVKVSIWAGSQPTSYLSAVMAHLLLTLEPGDFVFLNYHMRGFITDPSGAASTVSEVKNEEFAKEHLEFQ